MSQDNPTTAVAKVNDGTAQAAPDASDISDFDAVVNSIMPPLDRKGKRGPRTREERDYMERREALRQLLSQATRTNLELSEARAEIHSLSRQVNESAALARRAQTDFIEECQENDRRSLLRLTERRSTQQAMRVETQLTRLTGREPKHLSTSWGNQPVFRLSLQEFQVTITPGAYKLTIEGPGRKPTDFMLDHNGNIVPIHALAILAFMGIKRTDMREALTEEAYNTMFVQRQIVNPYFDHLNGPQRPETMYPTHIISEK